MKKNFRKVPRNVETRAKEIIESLSLGINHREFGGKIYNRAKGEIISIPLPRSYRLVVRRSAAGMVPTKILSHEEYNNERLVIS